MILFPLLLGLDALIPQAAPAASLTPEAWLRSERRCPPLLTPTRGAGLARVDKLGDLPPADMHLLILREVNGCPVPVIVVHDVERNLARPKTSEPPSGR